jgi:hypothetical protein
VKAQPQLQVKEIPIVEGSQQMHLFVRLREG